MMMIIDVDDDDDEECAGYSSYHSLLDNIYGRMHDTQQVGPFYHIIIKHGSVTFGVEGCMNERRTEYQCYLPVLMLSNAIPICLL